MSLLAKVRDRFFPDRLSLLLWPLALTWMAVIGNHGLHFWQMGHPKTWIFGGILMVFSPLPVALLFTRDPPDRERQRRLAESRKRRLAERTRRSAR